MNDMIHKRTIVYSDLCVTFVSCHRLKWRHVGFLSVFVFF